MSPFQPLRLPNGGEIPNRIAKAAMEENMADADQAPSAELLRLYRAWADGGVGLILSGNVMIDGRAMTGPGGVVLENERHLQRFREWARIGRSGGAQFWLQLNHPGRQVQTNLGQDAIAPSVVPMEMGRFSKLFVVAREMTEDDIAEVIRRFVRAATLAEQAGFSGVQIHAAHGYLLSQFLSPLVNKRQDRWGGSLENRARLLLEVVRAVRAAVSPGFCVGVKLNSADFQRGGFDASDARQVVEWLNAEAVDLVELSGGSYEAPAMQGDARDGRTLAREAYFLEFARQMREAARMPLMVTGGIRRLPVAQQVLDSGLDMVGIGTALALEPQLVLHWQRGSQTQPELPAIRWRSKPLAALAYMALVKLQLHRIGARRTPNPQASPLRTLVMEQWRTLRRARQYRRWAARQAD
ncbi:NADH:flavin oxidoreductase/NADH oxidase family protein [Pseudomonas sp. ZM23]|uniref:NADH:flavin oxidoreductase/NADH oxidase family protein n=1 Tax=Pseudomonas triclosanedens TaxID=2961893 RepID=A0ABY6ZTK3_9PSED|nr:NADH:flavin oxidoreductase/NADH oxidase family protein [Pseudomonas triclosanedens]MCP8466526.1 NADH:flavin oxidoreductase/NADH oxidase family protein [Pseudomonas triclosanedens]MCP8472119.1 NADH:flavin oxidoreductase/NADH oxidase family protein [Pseudomonas triclosanedens]MCP8474497.1 NADH:flavin oxidoreductase/NADH oxidase family protein [Pseudomonas triclosanedens]WAI48119.1 NADH:flavin oxidoreductase/NADH oxidase family protein [Pseudomonas triclosanedens]